MTELAIRDNGSSETPYRGSASEPAGVLLAGAAATRLQVETIARPHHRPELGSGASRRRRGKPFSSCAIVRKGATERFLLTTMGTTVAGGVAAWLLTRKSAPPPPATAYSLPRSARHHAESPPGFGPSRSGRRDRCIRPATRPTSCALARRCDCHSSPQWRGLRRVGRSRSGWRRTEGVVVEEIVAAISCRSALRRRSVASR